MSTVPPPHAPPRPTASQPLTPKIVGFLVAGAILIAVSLWVGDPREQSQAPKGPAALTLVAPMPGDTVTEPLTAEFATAAPLELTAAGWHAGSYHLHALVDGADRMPAAADILALGGGRFRWTVGAVGPGPHELRLIWARPDHRSIPEGASKVVALLVR